MTRIVLTTAAAIVALVAGIGVGWTLQQWQPSPDLRAPQIEAPVPASAVR